MSSRRPLAQAFRQITVSLAQYSYLATLFIQAGVLAFLLSWAVRRIALWRGIWAGIAFFGFVFLLHRPYLNTTMTEPLGLACALLALVHLIEALRQDSLPHALVALAALTAALLMRMGSLLTIPLLVLWIAFFVGGARRWHAVTLGVLTVAMVIALQALLGRIYGSHVGVTGENFAYTICGLSLGTDWFDCLHRQYAAELAGMPDQHAIVQFLLARTWENILQHPGVAATRLLENAAKLVVSQPRYLLPPAGPLCLWAKVMAGLGMLALVPGLLYAWRRHMSKAERWLWGGLFASVLMSAAIIYADDGWRALHVTHVLAAAFWSSAFASPGVVTAVGRVRSRPNWRSSAVALATAAVVFLVGPMLAREQALREFARHPTLGPVQPNQRIVLGARRVSGFLVVPDDAVLPASPPALRVSDFVRLLHLTTLEPEGGGLSRDAILKAPFAFVFVPDLLTGAIDLYVAPARLLEDATAWAWRIELRVPSTHAEAWKTLREVATAERLP